MTKPTWKVICGTTGIVIVAACVYFLTHNRADRKPAQADEVNLMSETQQPTQYYYVAAVRYHEKGTRYCIVSGMTSYRYADNYIEASSQAHSISDLVDRCLELPRPCQITIDKEAYPAKSDGHVVSLTQAEERELITELKTRRERGITITMH